MGEAFDRTGAFLGAMQADSAREVLEKLQEKHRDATEFRIRSLQAADQAGAGATTQMPRYRSHKEVWALKIKAVTHNSMLAALSGNESDGSALITPEDSGYAEFRVDAAYVRKHDPQPGGYYVAYADGYQSFSPAKAFEEGYTRV